MSDTERVLYLTQVRCPECGNTTTYAHEGEPTPVDMDAPWPRDVFACPECTTPYPSDIGAFIEGVHEAERVSPRSTDADTARPERGDRDV